MRALNWESLSRKLTEKYELILKQKSKMASNLHHRSLDKRSFKTLLKKLLKSIFFEAWRNFFLISKPETEDDPHVSPSPNRDQLVNAGLNSTLLNAS